MVNGSNDNIKVAFLLLCHGSVDVIKELLSLDFFDNENIHIYIHYDLKSTKENVQKLKEYVSEHDRYHFVEKRVICKWGMYSLVRATLNMMEEAVGNQDFKPDYIYLISAACHPVKPFRNLQNLLSNNYGKEFIQAYDVRYERWVSQGWDKERYQYYFPFCWYGQRRLFEMSCRFQERFGLNNRKIPIKMDMYFGSQWFCLTHNTCVKILETMEDKKLERFFELSWIPDEFAIQSLTVLLAGYENVTSKNLTFYQFNSYGRPLIMYDDHKEYVQNLPYIFARKISSQASGLRSWLAEYTSSHNKIVPDIEYEDIAVVPKDLEIHQQLYTHFTKQSKLGAVIDKWNDGIEKNQKKYFILTGPCQYIIKEMVKIGRNSTDFTFYNYIFAKNALQPAEEIKTYRGISKLDIKRRNYDSIGFLYQIIHSDEKNPVLFCLDSDDDSEHIQEVVRWSEEAQVLIVEPHWGNEAERFVSYVSEPEARSLLKINTDDAWISLREIINKKNRYYWAEKIHEGRKCRVSWLEDNNSEYARILREIKNKLPKDKYLTRSHLKLIDKLNGVNVVQNTSKLVKS